MTTYNITEQITQQLEVTASELEQLASRQVQLQREHEANKQRMVYLRGKADSLRALIPEPETASTPKEPGSVVPPTEQPE